MRSLYESILDVDKNVDDLDKSIKQQIKDFLKANFKGTYKVSIKPNSDGKYEDYVTQLTGSNCLFDFLHSVLVNFCQCSALNTYKRYFVVLHNLEYSPISSPIPLTRPVSNTEPTTAYIRKTTNNEVLTIRQLIR